MAEIVLLLMILALSSLTLSCSFLALRHAREAQTNVDAVWQILQEVSKRDGARIIEGEHQPMPHPAPCDTVTS